MTILHGSGANVAVRGCHVQGSSGSLLAFSSGEALLWVLFAWFFIQPARNPFLLRHLVSFSLGWSWLLQKLLEKEGAGQSGQAVWWKCLVSRGRRVTPGLQETWKPFPTPREGHRVNFSRYLSRLWLVPWGAGSCTFLLRIPQQSASVSCCA